MADGQNDDITPSLSPHQSFSDSHSHDAVRSEAALLNSSPPESEHFDDGVVSENGVCDVVQDQAVSFEFSNDPVLLKQEAELIIGSTSGVALEEQESESTVELSSAVLGKREMRVSEVQEFAAANGKNGDVSEERESGVSGTQSCEKIEFSDKMTSENGAILENRELGVSGTKSCEKLDVLGKMSSRNSAVMGQRELGVSGTQISGKCALKIEVIDDTALIDTSQVKDGVPKFFGNSKNNKRNVKQEMGEVNQEKRSRRRDGGSGKIKNSGADEKEKDVNLDLSKAQFLEHNENKMKKVYSRRELEAFRYQGVEGQKKKWFEVYCGLGPDVQVEYEGLVDRSHGHNQQQQQKKKRNKGKQHSVLNIYPGFQNQAPRPVFGALAAKGRGNHLTSLRTEECPIGIWKRDHLLPIQNFV